MDSLLAPFLEPAEEGIPEDVPLGMGGGAEPSRDCRRVMQRKWLLMFTEDCGDPHRLAMPEFSPLLILLPFSENRLRDGLTLPVGEVKALFEILSFPFSLSFVLQLAGRVVRFPPAGVLPPLPTDLSVEGRMSLLFIIAFSLFCRLASTSSW